MKSQRVKQVRRAGIAATLAAVLAFGVPSSSWAYWSASDSPASPTLTTATIPAPANLGCQSLSEGLLGASKYVKFSWTGVAEASTYNVYFSRVDGTGRVLYAAGLTNSTVEIRDTDLVGGLLDNIISLLIGNQSVRVDVVAVHQSGWTSIPSDPPKLMKRTGLIPLVLGGLACA